MNLRDFSGLLLLGAVWGASFLFMRIAAPQFGPLSLMGLRVGLAMCFTLPFLLRSKKKKELWLHKWDFLFMGLFNLAVPFALLSFATLRIEAGFTALLNSTTPIFAAIVSFFWLREKISMPKIGGILFGMAGIFVLFGDRMSFASGGTGFSVLAALGAALCYGVSSNVHRKKMRHLVPVEATAAALIWATITMTPLTILYWPSVTPDAMAWISVVTLAGVCTSFALILYLAILNRAGVLAATSVTFLIPIFAIVWGWAFLHEPVTGRLLGGLPLVLAGTALTLGFVEKLHKKIRSK